MKRQSALSPDRISFKFIPVMTRISRYYPFPKRFAVTALALLLSMNFQVSLSAMTNGDVIKMLQAGISEDTVQLAVRNDSEDNYNVEPDGLIELKEADVPEAVIQEIIRKANGEGEDSSGAAVVWEDAFPDVAHDKVFPPVINPVEGQKYFTRINFWAEDGESIATNYSRGTLIPINTEVELIRVKSDTFRIRIAEMGILVDVENVEKYTGVDIRELLSRYLAEEKTRIDLYGDEAATHIRAGIMRLGMTKDQVILTRGYPPSHRTASLDLDVWVYWSSRFVQLTIVFENGRLSEGRGLN